MPNVESGKYWDAAWNPITGCTDEYGCWERCWARAMSKHFPKLTGGDFKPRFHLKRLDRAPGGKGKYVATCWLGDIFACEEGPYLTFLDAMNQRPQHTFLILSKRVEVMSNMADCIIHGLELPAWPRNCFVGTSVSCQEDCNCRLPVFTAMPAPRRWVSIEPLLGQTSLARHLKHIDWVIVGSETGPGARACDPDWIRVIRDECKQHGVPLSVKQVNGKLMLDDLPADLRVREVPAGV